MCISLTVLSACLVCVCGGGVGLPWGRGLPVAAGYVPLHHVAVGPYLQCVEVVQVARDVVLGVLAVVGQTTEQEHLQ